MGDHDAPERWLDRWRAQEPVRLYLWSVASAVLAGCVVAGWLTQELALAITGPVAAALMLGGTAAARGQAYAPATVSALQADWEQRTDQLLEDEHAATWTDAWQTGWEAGVDAAVQAAEETGRTPEKVAQELRPQAPETAALSAQEPCTYTEDGRRCTLPRHPEGFPHQLEAVGVQE